MQNPQANAIVECTHQMLGNLIRSFQLQDRTYCDLDDPWGGMLVAVASSCTKIYVTYDSVGNAWPAPLW
jgi:hypothetical protein